MVRDAAESAAPARVADDALAQLCQAYWPAIYSYIRHHGYGADDAQDLTQSFFEHILENRTLRRASREKGRFRSFLLGALKLCLADEQAHRHALKRGGGVRFLSLGEIAAEEAHHQGSSDLSPDEALDARWAGLLLDHAIAALRDEYADNSKSRIFNALSSFLGGEKRDISYDQAAARLGIGVPAVKTLIHRLRREFAATVRREIMQTVSAPHEVDGELRQLRSVFARAAERGS
jgi:RNA polymerase sigma-70 factor (ECF subfamily)